MSILSKLLSKKKERDVGRISGCEIYERKIACPIEFMTRHGGAEPLDFNIYNEKSRLMNDESINCLQQAIDEGCVDQFTDLSLFVHMLKQRAEIYKNEIVRQSLERKNVGDKIKVTANETLILLRKERDEVEDTLIREKLKGTSEADCGKDE